MYTSVSRRILYLDLFDLILNRPSPTRRRSVSTTSAINRGLRATRDVTYTNSPRTYERKARRSNNKNSNDDDDDDNITSTKSTGSVHISISNFSNGKRLLPKSKTPSPYTTFHHTNNTTKTSNESEQVYTSIRRISELIRDIQSAEAIDASSTPRSLIQEARQKLHGLNVAIRGDQGNSQRTMEGERKEWIFYLRRHLSRMNGLVREDQVRAEEGGMNKTVVLESESHTFTLVEKGERLRGSIPSRMDMISTPANPGILYNAVKGTKTIDQKQEAQDSPGSTTTPISPLAQLTQSDPALLSKIVRLREILYTLRSRSQTDPDLGVEDSIVDAKQLLVDLRAFDSPQHIWKRGLEQGINNRLAGRLGFKLKRALAADGKTRMVTIKATAEDDEFELVLDEPEGSVRARTANITADPHLRKRVEKPDDEAPPPRTDRDNTLIPTPLQDLNRIRALLKTIRDLDATQPGYTAARNAAIAQMREFLRRLNDLQRSSWSYPESLLTMARRMLGKDKWFVEGGGNSHSNNKPAVLVMSAQGDLELVLDGDGGKRNSTRAQEQQQATHFKEQLAKRTDAPGKKLTSNSDSRDRRAIGPTVPYKDKNTLATSTSTIADTDKDTHMPLSIPYTTAASQFLYGTNVVLAALRARRRKLYRLYLSPQALTRSEGTTHADAIPSLARQAGIRIFPNANPRLLDKLSEGRPHNGVVLEASALPAPPVLSLGRPDPKTNTISLVLDRQCKEDLEVNGAPSTLPTTHHPHRRQPFVLMVDGITDPGNLGNIIRTAHFYSATAVAVATNTCADLSSPILAKASSGACEAVPLLSLLKPANFVFEAAKTGWRVYAAVAPGSVSRSVRDRTRYVTTTTLAEEGMERLGKGKGCLLMLGAEGEGLRANLVGKAEFLVGIERVGGEGGGGGGGTGELDVGVDSLNVGVAAGVLMEAFLRAGMKDNERHASSAASVLTIPGAKAESGAREEENATNNLGW